MIRYRCSVCHYIPTRCIYTDSTSAVFLCNYECLEKRIFIGFLLQWASTARRPLSSQWLTWSSNVCAGPVYRANVYHLSIIYPSYLWVALRWICCGRSRQRDIFCCRFIVVRCYLKYKMSVTRVHFETHNAQCDASVHTTRAPSKLHELK